MYLCSCNIHNLPDHFQVYQQLERHADLYIFDFIDIVTILIAFLIAYFINPLVNRIDHIPFQPDNLSEVCKAAQVPFSAAGLCHCHRLYCLVLTFVIPQIVESILD